MGSPRARLLFHVGVEEGDGEVKVLRAAGMYGGVTSFRIQPSAKAHEQNEECCDERLKRWNKTSAFSLRFPFASSAITAQNNKP